LKSNVNEIDKSGQYESPRKLIESKIAVMDFLVTNFIDRIFLSPALEKLVGAIENKALSITCIFISVNNAWWNNQKHRAIDAYEFDLFVAIGWGVFSCIPEIDFEVGGPDEAETIGLFVMFVWSACNAGFGHGNISHDRVEFLG
jgi:hypothetical protein